MTIKPEDIIVGKYIQWECDMFIEIYLIESELNCNYNFYASYIFGNYNNSFKHSSKKLINLSSFIINCRILTDEEARYYDKLRIFQ